MGKMLGNIKKRVKRLGFGMRWKRLLNLLGRFKKFDCSLIMLFKGIVVLIKK